MRAIPVSAVKFSNSFKSLENEPKTTTLDLEPRRPIEKDRKALPLVTSALALAAVTVSAVTLKRVNNAAKKEEAKIFKESIEVVKNEIEALKTQINNSKNAEEISKLTESLNKTEEKLNGLLEEFASVRKYYDGWIGDVDKRTTENASKSIVQVLGGNIEKNIGKIDDFMLVQNLDNEGKQIPLSQKTITYLENIASEFINGKRPLKQLSKKDCAWALSVETKWCGTGGQGTIFTQFSKNAKEVGANVLEMLPLHELTGAKKYSIERLADGKVLYHCNQGEPIQLKPFAKFKVDVYRNGRRETEEVIAHYCEDAPKSGNRAVFFENSHYFESPEMYARTATSTEQERYAGLYARAVDTLARYKVSQHLGESQTHGVEVLDKHIMDSIDVPKAYYINDWSAASIAALGRLKAPVEASKKEVSQKLADWFSDMNMTIIDHNLDYQGSVWGQEASDVVNTLFDKYAMDIYRYAKTGFNDHGMEGISKVLTIGNNFNCANIGMCLTNVAKPVSPNYAKEVATQAERSYGLLHVAEIRYNAGTLVGRSNPWDKAENQILSINLSDYNKNLNKDKIEVLRSRLSQLTLNEKERGKVDNELNRLNIDCYTDIIARLKEHKIKEVDALLEKMEQEGSLGLRTFNTYTHKMSIEEVLAARKHNKTEFVDHLRSMVDYNKKHEGFFNVITTEHTDLSDITAKTIDDTVVISMGARFTDQKGIDIAAGVIKAINKEWKTLYPNKPMPLFVIGGQDTSGGKYRELVTKTIKELGEDGKHVVQIDGWCPNNILQGGADFAWFPSHFEPDGSKWEALYKGTPAICTKVGGHVDSIQDGINGFLTRRTIPEIGKEVGSEEYLKEMISDFKESTMRAIDMYYNDKPALEKMIDKDIKSNVSWIIHDSQNKVLPDCGIANELKSLGYDLSTFDNFAK